MSCILVVLGGDPAQFRGFCGRSFTDYFTVCELYCGGFVSINPAAWRPRFDMTDLQGCAYGIDELKAYLDRRASAWASAIEKHQKAVKVGQNTLQDSDRASRRSFPGAVRWDSCRPVGATRLAWVRDGSCKQARPWLPSRGAARCANSLIGPSAEDGAALSKYSHAEHARKAR